MVIDWLLSPSEKANTFTTVQCFTLNARLSRRPRGNHQVTGSVCFVKRKMTLNFVCVVQVLSSS